MHAPRSRFDSLEVVEQDPLPSTLPPVRVGTCIVHRALCTVHCASVHVHCASCTVHVHCASVHVHCALRMCTVHGPRPSHGVVGVLQGWTLRKRLERFAKTWLPPWRDGPGISAVPPPE